jgi:hypothetical protein
MGSSAATKSEAPAAGQPSGAKAKLDNPILYSKGKDGALRKLMDDGGSGVFYRARSGDTSFTAYEKQRLFATAALDSLLKQAVASDPLCRSSFVLTNDGLLRTYPYSDMLSLEGAKDLTETPLFAWDKAKANTQGVVWTAPYASWISDAWVVACLSPVKFGDKLVAVAGCELSLEALQKDVLSFSLGSGSACWLQRPDGVLLAATAGGEELLGATALAGAPLPDEEVPARKITDEANLFTQARAVFLEQIAAEEIQHAAFVQAYGEAKDGKYLATAPLDSQDWLLGATIQSALAQRLALMQTAASRVRLRGLLLLSAVLLIGLGLAYVLGWITARGITRPLRVVEHRAREVALTGKPHTVALSDDSEVGALAHAVQQAFDRLLQGQAAGSPESNGNGKHSELLDSLGFEGAGATGEPQDAASADKRSD